MNAKGFYQFLTISAAIITGCLATKLTLTADKTKVQIGDDVVLKLFIQDFQPGSVIKWKKVVSKETVQLGDNHILNDYYKDSRYTLTLQDVGNSNYNIFFNITGIALEDAGQYRVDWDDGTHKENSSVTLSVIVEPQAVRLYLDGTEVTDGDVHDMEQDSVHSLRCVVEGAAPAAQLYIEAGSSVVSRDTPPYTMTTLPVTVTGQLVGLQETTYNSELKGADIKFDAHYGNKQISCKVKDSQMKSAAFTTKFPGVSPLWAMDCPDVTQSHHGAHDVLMECSVTASPKADISIVWHHRHHPDSTNLFVLTPTTPVEDRPPHYNIHAKEIDETTQNVSLLIATVKPQMFRNYTFIAKNELGEASYIVLLERDPTKEIDTNSATTHHLMSAFYILCAAICFLFH